MRSELYLSKETSNEITEETSNKIIFLIEETVF
jgi:hypothetical protein